MSPTPIIVTATPDIHHVDKTPTAKVPLTAEERAILYPWIGDKAKFFHYTDLQAQTHTCTGKPNVYGNGTPIRERVAATVCYRRERVSAHSDRLTIGWAFCCPSDRNVYNRAKGRTMAWKRMTENPTCLTIKADMSPPTAALDFLKNTISLVRSHYVLRQQGLSFSIPDNSIINGLPRWYQLDTWAQEQLFKTKAQRNNQ